MKTLTFAVALFIAGVATASDQHASCRTQNGPRSRVSVQRQDRYRPAVQVRRGPGSVVYRSDDSANRWRSDNLSQRRGSDRELNDIAARKIWSFKMRSTARASRRDMQAKYANHQRPAFSAREEARRRAPLRPRN